MTAPCSSLGRTRTPCLIVIVRKPRTVAPRGPGEGGTSRSPVRPGRGKECDARSTRVRRPLADHPRLRWLGRKSRLTSGQRAPLHPASGPYPPRADPFATRTPVGLLPSPARGGQILHACRKDTVIRPPLVGGPVAAGCAQAVQDGQEDRSLDIALEAAAVEELLDDPLAPRLSPEPLEDEGRSDAAGSDGGELP